MCTNDISLALLRGPLSLPAVRFLRMSAPTFQTLFLPVLVFGTP